MSLFLIPKALGRPGHVVQGDLALLDQPHNPALRHRIKALRGLLACQQGQNQRVVKADNRHVMSSGEGVCEVSNLQSSGKMAVI